MEKKKIFAGFGEIMLRLAAPERRRLIQSLPGTLTATFGGGEANVCVALASLGAFSRFLTVLPENPVVQSLMAELRGRRVDVSYVMTTPRGRLGTYYVEHGAAQRGSGVWYDRDGSALALTPAAEYDWHKLLEGVGHLHLTGITPALSRRAYDATLAAARFASEQGCTVSCDLNFRKKLWRWDRSAAPAQLACRCMTQIVAYADWIIGNEADAADVFGIHPATGNCETGELDAASYRTVAAELAGRFPKASRIAFTLRNSISADYNTWGGMLYDCRTGVCVFAPFNADGGFEPYAIRDIVDRFGGGDSFAAGLIFALNDREYDTPEKALSFAVASSCLKHSIAGDFNLVNKAEVNALMDGNASGRVVR